MKHKKKQIDLNKVNSILESYKNEEIDDDLSYSLSQIPFQSKKLFSLFSLLPREFAFTTASIMIALYAGILFSTHVLNANSDDFFVNEDFFEQISLVSLIDR